MDSIFKSFICRDGDPDAERRKGYAMWFIDAIPASEFAGDDYIFYRYLEYSSLLKIPVKFDYFTVWLATDLRKVLKSSGVKIPSCETLNYELPQAFETAVLTTKECMSDNFRVLEQMESGIDDFVVDMHAFMVRRLRDRMTEILSKTYDTQSKTDDVVQASDYALKSLQMVQDIYAVSKLEELGMQGITSKSYMVSDSGIPAIDNDSGGIWSKQVFDVEAQSGAGKTRFVIGTYLYRCAVIHKHNVLYISMEEPEESLIADIVALHTFNMFNIQIDAKMIERNRVPPEYTSHVEAARIDLFESGKYGKIKFKYEVLKRETFRRRLDALDSLNGPFDLVAIDYLGLFEQDSSMRHRDDKYAVISDSLKYFKRWCVTRNKAGITVSQFNREGIAAGLADKTITTEHAEGGISVFRHCDYNIAISFTADMKAKQLRRIQQPKVRGSAGFQRFMCDTRLSFCYWRQVKAKEV